MRYSPLCVWLLDVWTTVPVDFTFNLSQHCVVWLIFDWLMEKKKKKKSVNATHSDLCCCSWSVFTAKSLLFYYDFLGRYLVLCVSYWRVISCPGSSVLFVNTSGRHGGQRAQMLLPPFKENDTHCLTFMFYRGGATPATLNIYIKGTNTETHRSAHRCDRVGAELPGVLTLSVSFRKQQSSGSCGF